MRLIPAEPIIQFITDGLNNPDLEKAFGHDAIEILTEIEYAPTVDAVEVVRCEKCVYWQGPWDGSASPFGRCRRNDMTMAGSGFCSYGERRAKDGC